MCIFSGIFWKLWNNGDKTSHILLPFLDFCLSIWLWWQECFPEYWLLRPKTTKLQKKLLYRVPAQCLKRRNMYFRKINIHNSVSLVVEFYRRWVLKCKLFAQESTSSKEIVFRQSCDELGFVKKCRNCTFNVNCLCQKLTEFFQKKKSFKNINLGDNFFVKNIFSNFIF